MGWVFGILALLVFDFLMRCFYVRLILPIFNQSPSFSVELPEPDLRAEAHTIPTSTGLSLQACLFHPPSSAMRGLVIFLPELGGNRWMAPQYCQALLEAGIGLLAIDFRNQGDSPAQPDYKPTHWLTEFEMEDVAATVQYVRSHEKLSDLPLGVFGVSRGGTAALIAAARHPELERVACDSTFTIDTMMYHYTERWATLYLPQWLMNLLPRFHKRGTLTMSRWVAQYRLGVRFAVGERHFRDLAHKDMLLIAGKRDSYVPQAVIEEVQQRIGDRCELWIVKGAKHNAARRVATQEYDQRLTEFFSKMLAEPQSSGRQPSTVS